MNNINFDNLNKMIQYIENNLKNNIDINDLSKLVGVSSNSLQRIFSFLTEMSIVEYIKKRRLSKAFEEIKTTNLKIIDIAFEYQYNSAISFDRSFKKAFGITPMECREKNVTFKQFPIIRRVPDSQDEALRIYEQDQDKRAMFGFNYMQEKIDYDKEDISKIKSGNYGNVLYFFVNEPINENTIRNLLYYPKYYIKETISDLQKKLENGSLSEEKLNKKQIRKMKKMYCNQILDLLYSIKNYKIKV